MPTATDQPKLVLHQLPPSHPCATVRAALRLKGLEAEVVDLDMAGHNAAVEEVYGEGRRTVPGLLVDDRPVHGTVAILRRLEELRPDVAPLYPDPIADRVREAEDWADGHLQDLGRRLPWGALHFRPERLAALAGGGPLDPAGTDYAMRFVRAAWKYHGLSAARLAEDLAGLPAVLAQIGELVDEGVLGGEAPNAADLHVGATLRVIAVVGDVRPLVEASPGWSIVERFFRPAPVAIPAGAYPEGWTPTA
ncbi:glutathione S-transferase [Patulibacter brassicae]|jgi:glutathione S-transferase|uniref:Glutathione S-transferase n=1 Tax=Patulibacter brassicae TaxID=1705717 RepID=A0ABU4VMC9_9ACTN|nr:glutathione S-transferase [Patulibacter brassicae]MDX8152983.1 glutathione S-transferase [Patulibacter brassicae]